MPTPARWPVVVFDLDGTLVDTIGLIVASYQHAFTTVLGREEDEAMIRSWIGQPLIRGFRAIDAEHADELLSTYLAWNRANTKRLIRRYAGIDTLLADLTAAGVRVAAAASKLRGPAQEAVRLTGLTAYLDVLVTMEDTDAHKPDPAPLLLAVDRLGTGRRATRSTSATPSSTCARPATPGMAAVGVTWGAGTREDVVGSAPDVVAHTVDELRAALLG